MSDIQSNFSFLAEHDEQLVLLGMRAEHYFSLDPNTSMLKIRQFIELLAQLTAIHTNCASQEPLSLFQLIRHLEDEDILSPDIVRLFHRVRTAGNDANHSFLDEHFEALTALKRARQLAIWFHRAFGPNSTFNPGPFLPPSNPDEPTELLEEQLEELRTEYKQAKGEVEQAQLSTEALKRQQEILEREAERLREEQELLEEIAEEEERRRLELAREKELADEEAEALRLRVEDLEARLQSSQQAIRTKRQRALASAQNLDLTEAETRLLIDEQLREVGWEVDSLTMTHKRGARPEEGTNRAIAEWPMPAGRADYVLFLGLKPVAVIEAKRWSTNVYDQLPQALRYARDFQLDKDMESPGGPWAMENHDVTLPFIFSANGRSYLRQLEQFSGVWFRDLRSPTNLSRALDGWYSPTGLENLLASNLAAANERLAEESMSYLTRNLGLRDYQLDAVKAAERAIRDGRRSCMLAMATGTGKTRTCVGLMYRLLKTGRFRRILFLVDRTALGVQAVNALENTKVEQQRSLPEIYNILGIEDASPPATETRLHIATVQGMMHRILLSGDDPAPSVDTYDCIIVDECHRGYTLDQEMSDTELEVRDELHYRSKYRAVLDHFDAVKIGLTATPAKHTVQIFGMPVYTYSYRDAVLDGYLVDHEPPLQITTALSEAGIKWEEGTKIKRLNLETGSIDLDTLEDEVEFELSDFNSRVIVESFNRVVCQYLVENIDPYSDEKTLIFCVQDNHADMVVRLLRELFAEKEPELPVEEAIVKITGSVDKPLQCIREYRNERFPNIAVTVDLLTTGVDIPKISNLVFLRRVKSRILYEQMLGRATRLCPEIGKECFHIIDAVNLYDGLQDITSMKPLVAQPSIDTQQLAHEVVGYLDNEDALRQAHKQLVARLQRRRQSLTEDGRSRFEERMEQGVDEFFEDFRKKSAEDVATFIDDDPGFIAWFEGLSRRGHGIAIAEEDDELVSVSSYYGGKGSPQNYIDAFQEYIRSHINQYSALQVVTTRPGDLTRQQLKELVRTLEEDGFEEKAVAQAWHDATNEEMGARIIGYIRQAALGDHLRPYEERVGLALKEMLARREWSQAQEQWLERFARQITADLVIDAAYLDSSPNFKREGGLRRLNRIFDDEVEGVLCEFQELIWAQAENQDQEHVESSTPRDQESS